MRRLCFNYLNLLLFIVASLAASLLFSMDDDDLTIIEALRAACQAIIAAVAYTQQPLTRRQLALSTREYLRRLQERGRKDDKP